MTVLTGSTKPAYVDLTPTTEELLCHRELLPANHPGRRTIRTRVVEANLPFARRLALRYAGRGELLDDLYQVAGLALVKAVDRYDPARSKPFASFAAPTILGDLKRHFRDASRGIHVSRGVQELSHLMAAATQELSQQLRHNPTAVELAAHLKVKLSDVLVARGAAHAYYVTSLSEPSSTINGDEAIDLIDLVGSPDPRYANVDDHLMLRPFLAALSIRDRRILAMRFYANMTQTQIAEEVGLSQMQVSRLLTQTLADLRVAMLQTSARRAPRRGLLTHSTSP